MKEKLVYTYAKLYLIERIKYWENRLNDVLTETMENNIKKMIARKKMDLASIKFDLSLMESKGNK